MDKNQHVTANFKAITYTLSISTNKGSVSMSPAGGSYNAGTQVTLTAIPNAGYVLSDWSGDLSGTTNPVKVTMNANKNVTANFERITYTVTTSFTNGSINQLGLA